MSVAEVRKIQIWISSPQTFTITSFIDENKSSTGYGKKPSTNLNQYQYQVNVIPNVIFSASEDLSIFNDNSSLMILIISDLVDLRERLDYSCAIFAPNGDLVANVGVFFPSSSSSLYLWRHWSAFDSRFWHLITMAWSCFISTFEILGSPSSCPSWFHVICCPLSDQSPTISHLSWWCDHG